MANCCIQFHLAPRPPPRVRSFSRPSPASSAHSPTWASGPRRTCRCRKGLQSRLSEQSTPTINLLRLGHNKTPQKEIIPEGPEYNLHVNGNPTFKSSASIRIGFPTSLLTLPDAIRVGSNTNRYQSMINNLIKHNQTN